MSKLSVTNFSKRNGSPFQHKPNNNTNVIQQDVVIQKTNHDIQKEKQIELQDKVNKKTAEIQSNRNANDGGCFTEVVSHGAFQGKGKAPTPEKSVSPKPPNGTKLMGFPSSANDLALEAKSDLESDKNISDEVKEKVIKKLFGLVAMVQHTYESKVRIMTEFEKFKEKYFKDELRREHEHSEQLYRLNMNFQTEVVEAIQHLKTELDINRNVSRVVENSGLHDNDIIFDEGHDTVDKEINKGISQVQDCEAND